MKDNKFQAVERKLRNYPVLKVDLKNLEIDLEEAQEVVGIKGESSNEKAGSPTHAFSSSVENEVIQRQKKIEHIKMQINQKEREIAKIENVLQILTEREMMMVEFRYFKDYSINRVCELLEITPTTFSNRKKKIIVKKLMPRFFTDNLYKKCM